MSRISAASSRKTPAAPKKTAARAAPAKTAARAAAVKKPATTTGPGPKVSALGPKAVAAPAQMTKADLLLRVAKLERDNSRLKASLKEARSGAGAASVAAARKPVASVKAAGAAPAVKRTRRTKAQMAALRKTKDSAAA